MTELTKRQRQAEARREQLIDSALELFSAKGYDNATIKNLADASGVTSGLLYHYFPDKQALLAAVVERHNFVPEMRGMLAGAEDRPASEMLLQIATRFSVLLQQRSSLVRVFVREAQTNPVFRSHWTAFAQEGVGLLAAYLKTRVEAGELRPHSTETTAQTLLYTVFMLNLLGEPSASHLGPLVDGLLYGVLDATEKGPLSWKIISQI